MKKLSETKDKFRQQLGLGLIELLVYIGIMAFVVVDLVSFTITIINIRQVENARPSH